MKNIRIILTPVDTSNRGDLEDIENQIFNSKNTLVKKMAIICRENDAQILTAEEFKKTLVFNKGYKHFESAMSNMRKRKQCYKLTDFMDDFNNQEFGGDTDHFWMGYVKVKQ